MKRMVALLIVGLLLSLTAANCVTADLGEDEDIIRNHGPIYVGSKPLNEYDDPGFIIGFYNRGDWLAPGAPRYLYSPHMLFGWDVGHGGPTWPFKYTLEIGAFASRALFDNFGPTFKGFFSGTEAGFICGFVDDGLTFYYGNFDAEVMN